VCDGNATFVHRNPCRSLPLLTLTILKNTLSQNSYFQGGSSLIEIELARDQGSFAMKNSYHRRTSKPWRNLLIVVVLSAGVILPPLALAVTFAVNTTIDRTDASPGDGRCETEPGNGKCTQRAAVQETNVLPGADVILVPSGLYALTLGGRWRR
jgi:hypothetical protein